MQGLLVNQSSSTIHYDVTSFLIGLGSENTRKAYKKDLNSFLKFAPTQSSDITRQHILAYRDSLMSLGLAPASINRKMSAIRSFTDFVRGQGLLNIDPFAGVKLPKTTVKDHTQAFTDEEVKRMLKLSEASSRDHLVLCLLFFAGLRRSEASQLLTSDLSLIEGVIVLRILGKGSKFRLIPCHPKLQQALVNYQEEARPFGSLLGIKEHTIFNTVKKYAKLAGVDRRVSPHSCRATAISQLLENGESPRNVADFAGHTSITTTLGSYDKKRDGIKNSSALKLKF